MRYILLGIKDYIKDRWHDWLVYHLWKFYKRPLYYDDYDSESFVPICDWLESKHVWHYISQRRYAAKNRKCKS